jgi:hypothetical protein
VPVLFPAIKPLPIEYLIGVLEDMIVIYVIFVKISPIAPGFVALVDCVTTFALILKNMYA